MKPLEQVEQDLSSQAIKKKKNQTRCQWKQHTIKSEENNATQSRPWFSMAPGGGGSCR